MSTRGYGPGSQDPVGHDEKGANIHDRVTKARELLLGVCSLLQDNEDSEDGLSMNDIETALQDAEAAVEQLEEAWNAMEQETQR